MQQAVVHGVGVHNNDVNGWESCGPSPARTFRKFPEGDSRSVKGSVRGRAESTL